MRTTSVAMVGLAALVAPTSAAFGQLTLDNPLGSSLPYVLDTGAWDGVGDEPADVYHNVIHVPGAAWIRVYFNEAQLGPGSAVRLTSVLDGEVQELDAAGLAMWSFGSAYFNGDAVEIELIAGPGTKANRLSVAELGVELHENPGSRGSSGQCGICGADDRVPSTEDWSCRLMSVGCTASVYTSNSCLVSAGHCISGGLVAQFRVPSSTAGCATVNPPVADQFPVTSTQQQNGGVGADWSVLRVGTNSVGQRPFQRYGQLRRITPVAAATTNPVEMFGFGIDQTCVRTQTQQRSFGTISAVLASSYQFNADVRGGNSGSGLLKDGRIIAIVTHCQVGCPNHGTRVDLAAFATARNNLCPACAADVDGNGIVDLNDLTTLLSQFGACYPDAAFAPESDLNSDNCVDLNDLSFLLSRFGTTCP